VPGFHRTCYPIKPSLSLGHPCVGYFEQNQYIIWFAERQILDKIGLEMVSSCRMAGISCQDVALGSEPRPVSIVACIDFYIPDGRLSLL
jgi:hypothetical protein